MKINTEYAWGLSLEAGTEAIVEQIEEQHNEEIQELKDQIADLKIKVSRLSSRLGNKDFTVYR